MNDKVNEAILGRDMFGEVVKPNIKGILKSKFLLPPFSVLNARDGDWQTRKRQWLSLGIQSEVGRGANALDMSAASVMPTDAAEVAEWNKQRRESPRPSRGLARCFGQDLMKGENPNFDSRAIKDHAWQAAQDARPQARLTWVAGDRAEESLDETSRKNLAAQPTSGTSIFDPVLCELMYDWFCPPGGQIIDPFCGGSVRGIVASVMGRPYIGCDLRQEQIDANYAQIGLAGKPPPTWVCSDAKDIVSEMPTSDFIFSCPPYGNLEVYSDDPRDLSCMDYPAFIGSLAHIVKLSVDKLRPGLFACFVVGDFRNKKGFYNNFVSDTIRCFLDAGMNLYNEIILVTSVGSLPIRITKQFEASRKIGKTHQNVLVFTKGTPAKI